MDIRTDIRVDIHKSKRYQAWRPMSGAVVKLGTSPFQREQQRSKAKSTKSYPWLVYAIFRRLSL